MTSPLGMRMSIGFAVGRLLMTGSKVVPKLAVAAVSAISGLCRVAGGPVVNDDDERQ